MLKTRLCELLGLDVPIILAPMGTCTSAELAAAVSNEGGLGGIGSPPPPLVCKNSSRLGGNISA